MDSELQLNKHRFGKKETKHEKTLSKLILEYLNTKYMNVNFFFNLQK